MYSPTAIQSSSSFTDGLVSFTLSSLPDYTDFTNLYDHYRVDKLVVHFISSINDVNIANSIQDVGTLVTAVDFDGGATGLTYNQFLSYESCEMTPHCKNKTITIQPKAELAAKDNTAAVVSVAESSTKNLWWDCSNVNIPFYGVRYALTPESNPTGYHVWYTVWVEAFVTFKNTR